METDSTDRSIIDPTMVILIHKALRRDIERLTTALAHDTDHEFIDALLGRWDDYRDELHQHHEDEDLRLAPRVKLPDPSIQATMEAEHKALIPFIDRADAAMQALRSKGGSGRDDARAALRALGGELQAHLAHEEEIAIPAVVAAISPAAFIEFQEDVRAQMTPEQTAWFLPWVLEGATPQERSAVTRPMPPFVVDMLQDQWEPAYRQLCESVWG
jgi:hemerythrin-like domain-containing protein